MKVIPINLQERTCGSCNTCCKGWLQGTAHGHTFWPGRPCFFIGEKGCSIYDDRPVDPCVKYKCLWLSNTIVPNWMRPDMCNVILSPKVINGVEYVEFTEAGSKLPVEVLSWAFMKHATGEIPNIRYQISGGWNFIGTPQFVAEMQKI